MAANTSAFDWVGETLKPNETLYYLDGPAIFTQKIGPYIFLFVKADEREASDYFIASHINEKILRYLRNGQISVRGALLSGSLLVFELDLDLKVLGYQEVTDDEVSAYLPKLGIGIKSEFGLVPDSVQQSEAAYAFKFFGDELTEKGMPLSTFKNVIDDVYKTLKTILTPSSLGQGKTRGVIDFPMRPLEFASLVVAIDGPQIDEGRLKRGKNTKGLDAATMLAESDELGIGFANDLKRTVDVVASGTVPNKFAEDNFDFLLAIVDILPSQKSEIKRLQFSANNVNGGNIFVDVDLLTAEKIRASVSAIDDSIIETHGFISGVLAKSSTLRIQTRFKREVTCKLQREVFDDLLASDKLSIGRPIIVLGNYTKRPLRDYMSVEGYPTFP